MKARSAYVLIHKERDAKVGYSRTRARAGRNTLETAVVTKRSAWVRHYIQYLITYLALSNNVMMLLFTRLLVIDG